MRRIYVEVHLLLRFVEFGTFLVILFCLVGPVGSYIGNSERVVTLASDTSLKAGMVITDGM